MKLLIELGLKWGGIFRILKKFLKIFFFKKVHYFWVWRLFFGVWGGFGEFDLFLGLGIVFLLFVFCFRLFFELFSVLKGALKPWFYIVVMLVLILKFLISQSTNLESTIDIAFKNQLQVFKKLCNTVMYCTDPIGRLVNPFLTALLSSMSVF